MSKRKFSFNKNLATLKNPVSLVKKPSIGHACNSVETLHRNVISGLFSMVISTATSKGHKGQLSPGPKSCKCH